MSEMTDKTTSLGPTTQQGQAIEMIEPDAPDDEEKWYRIQFDHTWYAIRACCRSCATRKMHQWLEGWVQVMDIPPPVPDWQVKL